MIESHYFGHGVCERRKHVLERMIQKPVVHLIPLHTKAVWWQSCPSAGIYFWCMPFRSRIFPSDFCLFDLICSTVLLVMDFTNKIDPLGPI